MERAGILSMQRILNYGSFLQAYSLKMVLEELGWEVEFVDYHPGKCLVETSEKKGIQRRMQKALEALRYRASFGDKLRFIRYKKTYAEQYFPLLGIEKNHMNYAPRLDLLVIGSDEVFNCVQNNTNVGYSRELFGYGNRASKTVAYAASFGNTTLDKIEKYGIAETVRDDLSRLDCISVRDRNSQDIVRRLLGKEPPIYPDPVLLYDWGKYIPERKPMNEKYLLVYGYSGRFSAEECRCITAFAGIHGLKIVSLGGIQNLRNTFMNCSPLEVPAWFANAEYVITDTFHGTVLSVVTHRRFAAFVREHGYGNSEKLGSLLEMLGLEDRKVTASAELDEKIQDEIGYAEIDSLLAEWRVEAYGYLKNQTRQWNGQYAYNASN